MSRSERLYNQVKQFRQYVIERSAALDEEEADLQDMKGSERYNKVSARIKNDREQLMKEAREKFAPETDVLLNAMLQAADFKTTGLDDTSKLKSIKPKHGYFRFVWFEEFSELNGANHVRSVMQSVVRGQGKFTVFRSFNPPISRNNWANTFIEQPDTKAVTLHTSYLDVPAEWLGESFLDEAERLKEINPKAYDNEYLGIATGSGGEVFENIQTRTITDKELDNIQYQYGGIDFGFSADPAVFVRVGYDRKSETVYILNEIYKKHLSNNQLYEAIKEKKLDSTGTESMNFFGSTQLYDGKLQVTCDAAEPKSISDLRTLGLNAHPCKKYQGSVMYGIKWLQHRNIVIDKERTPNTYREFTHYEYATTKDGEFLADVPDKDNHTIDAVRYALDRLINDRKNSA